MFRLSGIFCCAALVASAQRPTLFIIGDSTVNNHTAGLLGWGDPIKAYFDLSKIDVENKARGGRSSRTFITEGLWDQMLADLKSGDFVLMQFGHNDGGSIDDPKDRASLKGTGDETQENAKHEIVHTYGWYMRKYIADAKAKGAIPIVLSPVPRNEWRKSKLLRTESNYRNWARESAEASGARFVDLSEIIARKYEEMGQEAVASKFFVTDHTHTTPAGAELNAASVVEGLNAVEGGLMKPYLTIKH